jgi:biopolymer transport protein ExbB
MNTLFNDITRFLQAGGPVLVFILLVTVLMCVLIADRYRFFMFDVKTCLANGSARWQARQDHHSWYALQIRTGLIAQTQTELNKHLHLIGFLIAICPMLGLLGTVSGMISVFDVMAITGTGNAREMAAGISQATLPTMAGMVVSLLGLYFRSRFDALGRRYLAQFEDSLVK